MGTISKPVKIVIMGDAKNAQQAFDQARAAAATTAKAMAASFAAAGGAFALIEGSVIKTSAEFEKFRTQLDTIEGSSTKAAASMEWITQFTKRTPFELNQVTDAFVQLKAFGIDPIANDSLKILGNTSAAMGRTLDQGVQALADAVTGEFERLKEFGIKARTVGDQVQFSYQQNGQEMVATADKTSQQMIQATLLGIFNDKYQGGMDKLSATWDGMTSNMADSWTIFQKQIGDAGAFGAAKNSLAIVLDELQKNDAEVKALATNISDGLVTAMEAGVTGIALTAKGFAAMGVAADGARAAVDLVALGVVDTFDVALSGLQSFYDALAHLPGSIGQPYAQASKDIATFRTELGHLETGIKQTGGESTAALIDGLAGLSGQFDAIDKKAVKFVSAMEKARGAAIPSGSAASAAPGAPSSATPSSQPSGPSPEVVKATADAKKIIDIHSVKFQRIQILGQAAFADQQTMLLAKNDADIAALDAERQRMRDAAAAQGASKAEISNLNDYYDQLKIDRAQQTADAISSIDQKSAAKQAQITKAAGDAKLALAEQSMGAISSLLAGHGKKAFALSKAFAIGQTVISTYSAAQKAYESQLAIPDPSAPFRAALAAGIAVAQGVARVSAIASTSYGSSSVSASAGGSTTPGGLATQGGFGGAAQRVPFNPTQHPTTPGTGGGTVIQITQHITAPNSQPGQEQAIAAAAQIATHQALAAVNQDFSTNGPLRQQLAV